MLTITVILIIVIEVTAKVFRHYSHCEIKKATEDEIDDKYFNINLPNGSFMYTVYQDGEETLYVSREKKTETV